MKNLTVILALVLLIGVVFIFGKQIFLTNKELDKSQSSDEKILVVKEFWQEALNQGDVAKYITSTPQEFYNETPRCSAKDVSNKDDVIKMTTNNGFMRDLKNTAVDIGMGQFTLVNASVYKYWEKEAIVDVDFARTENHNFTEKRFFFLFLVDGKWKVFMDTSVPVLENNEYANFECLPQQ